MKLFDKIISDCWSAPIRVSASIAVLIIHSFTARNTKFPSTDQFVGPSVHNNEPSVELTCSKTLKPINEQVCFFISQECSLDWRTKLFPSGEFFRVGSKRQMVQLLIHWLEHSYHWRKRLYGFAYGTAGHLVETTCSFKKYLWN